MKSTPVCLLAFCTSFITISATWAGPTDVSASIRGSITGRDSTGATIGVFSEPLLDFGSANAGVFFGPFVGGSDVATGKVGGGASVTHPDELGRPGLMGIDVGGSAAGTRELIPNTNGVFDSLGSLLASVTATVEYHDEITVEFEQDDGTPLTIEGFLFLDGFATLDAVANGGFPADNVTAALSGRLSGTQTLPTVFGAIKKATGEVIVSPGQTNILAFNPIIDFRYDFFHGVPFPIFMELTLTGSAAFGDLSFATRTPGTAFAAFEAHYGNTLRWGGITKVINRLTGEEVTNWRVTSASGFDYSQTFPIPEPPSPLLLIVGTLGLGFRTNNGAR